MKHLLIEDRINWCPMHQTFITIMENKHNFQKNALYSLLYPRKTISEKWIKWFSKGNMNVNIRKMYWELFSIRTRKKPYTWLGKENKKKNKKRWFILIKQNDFYLSITEALLMDVKIYYPISGKEIKIIRLT